MDDDTGIYDNIPATASKSDSAVPSQLLTSHNSVKVTTPSSSPRVFTSQNNSPLTLDTSAPPASPRSSSLAKSQVTSQFSPKRPLSAGSRTGSTQSAHQQSAQKLTQALDKQNTSSSGSTVNKLSTSQQVPAAARARVGASVRSDVISNEIQSAGKPIPAEKPSELQSGRAVTSLSGASSSSTAVSSGTTVFTTPSGTRISLNVGPGSASASGSTAATVHSPHTRKSSSSRDVTVTPNRHPPPIPSKPTGLQTPVPAPRKESPARAASVVVPVQHHQTASAAAAPSRISAVAQRFESPPQQHSPRSVTSSHSLTAAASAAGAHRYSPDIRSKTQQQHPPQVSLFK